MAYMHGIKKTLEMSLLVIKQRWLRKQMRAIFSLAAICGMIVLAGVALGALLKT